MCHIAQTLDNNASVPHCRLPAFHIHNFSGKFILNVGDNFSAQGLLSTVVIRKSLMWLS